MGPTRFFFSPLPTPVPYASHTERRLRFSHTECPRSPSRSSPPPVPSHRRPRPSISVALLLRAMHVCGGGCLWVAHACGIVISRASTPAEAVGEGAAAMSGVGVRRGGEWRHRWLKAKSEAHAPFSVTKENTFRKYNAGNTRRKFRDVCFCAQNV
uniref:Uncharacterized protein n=1 Tax=Oryza glumipatula TaxID=40148 RepID=A0A0E0A9H4_9ORYZ